MEHDSKQDAQDTVEHGDGNVTGRSPGGRFGPGNTFAAAQRGRPKGVHHLLREMMREAIDRAGRPL